VNFADAMKFTISDKKISPVTAGDKKFSWRKFPTMQ
jgi:hypothetical protein